MPLTEQLNAIQRGHPAETTGLSSEPAHQRGPKDMLHVGLDLSRQHLDVHALGDDGETGFQALVSPRTAEPRRSSVNDWGKC